MSRSFIATTPFRYAVAFSILLIISTLMAMSVIYFHFYAESESTARERLEKKVAVISNSPIPSIALHQLPSDMMAFTLKKPLPAFLEELADEEDPVILSAQDVRQLKWHHIGFDGRALAALVPLSNGYVLVGLPVLSITLSLLLKVTFYISLVILLVMLCYSFLVSRRMLYNINLIDRTAQRIMKGELKKRISLNPRKRDEYSSLIQTLNAMLEKNQQLMFDLRQVNQNIAHDLKTPLNRLRSRMEVALLKSENDADYPAILADSIDDIDDLLATFNALLLLGNLEFQSQKYTLVPLRIDTLLNDLAELYVGIAEEKQQTFSTSIAESISILAHQHLFAQALSNLIDNAIKYTPEGGHISLALYVRQASAIITITDNGPGIPAAERTNVFERFNRLDASRQQPGNGLGLSLVQSILNIHRADIRLSDNYPGLVVEISARIVESTSKTK